MARAKRGTGRAKRVASSLLALAVLLGGWGSYRWATDLPVPDPNYPPCPDLDWQAAEARGGASGPLPQAMPTDWLRNRPIAHRGLYDPSKAIAENSLSAFRAAADAGYPIELDVQLSRDGEAMVFHDPFLDRMTGVKGRVCDFTASELEQFHLGATVDSIPTLAQVFAAVGKRVPILIETKRLDYPVGPLEERVARLIVAYGGPVAIHSFSPDSLGWFAEHLPAVPRGQIAMDYAHAGTSFEYTSRGDVMLSGLHKWALTNLLRFPTAEPDFVSYDLNDLPRTATTIARWLGLPLLAWTVDSPDAESRAQGLADNIIFEKIRPASPAP
jgi:glycerophosphoryl diester phosphodiesterase